MDEAPGIRGLRPDDQVRLDLGLPDLLRLDHEGVQGLIDRPSRHVALDEIGLDQPDPEPRLEVRRVDPERPITQDGDQHPGQDAHPPRLARDDPEAIVQGLDHGRVEQFGDRRVGQGDHEADPERPGEVRDLGQIEVLPLRVGQVIPGEPGEEVGPNVLPADPGQGDHREERPAQPLHAPAGGGEEAQRQK